MGYPTTSCIDVLGFLGITVLLTVFLPKPLANANTPAEVQFNDNRVAAGQLTNGVLTVRLEIRDALWNPEGENGPNIPIQAFGEEGKPAINPGPMIRVRQGTRLHIFVRNLLRDQTVAIHGLNRNSAKDGDSIIIAPGAIREIDCHSGPPGTYFYWATSTGVSLGERSGIDGQLSGAFIVDRLGGHNTTDRVFVLGHWFDEGNPRAIPPKPEREAWVINGKSWPHTERLQYAVGQDVRWRLINSTDKDHPMHLHGHYFWVDGIGDEERWKSFPSAQRRRVVTEPLRSGNTLALSWTPERAGNWLFHCHVLFHVDPGHILTPATSHSMHEEHDSLNHMAGLVLGVAVSSPISTGAPHGAPTHKLRLVVGERSERLGKLARFGYQLAEVEAPGTLSFGAFKSPGTPIILTRGQPVEIAIENRISQSTSVHWHGIELESYYDGVPGWGGDGRQVTPPIRPGEVFVARFTPPRAGTFMYHTHLNDYHQLSGGLYRPLIVVDPGRHFDPETDKILMIARGPDEDNDPVLINGSSTPAPLQLRAGTRYRFRIMQITPGNGVQISLEAAGDAVKWRAIAKDGAMLPRALSLELPAKLRALSGETYDFQFCPRKQGLLRFSASVHNGKIRTELPMIIR